MAFLSASERAFMRAVSNLARHNPFLPERIAAEREALGADFREAGPVWRARPEEPGHPNAMRINARVQALAEVLRERLSRKHGAAPGDLALYDDLISYLLYTKYEEAFFQLITAAEVAGKRVGFYTHFVQDLCHYLGQGNGAYPAGQDPAHLFALFFQIRRGFHLIFRNILGGSMPVARLRAAAWQSIFTSDLGRYRRSLYARMGDIPTLIVGPSGTGKELVAQAIALARYIPFDSATQSFQRNFAASFHPLSLSALPTTLVESELFGHKRGTFTGAVQDRQGWLETCPASGTVFLDEIAEVDAAIQVKLLRVLETRSFQRLGETHERRFMGKIIAATNRDLAHEIQRGRFREDLYFRLCADLIVTPSLAERLRDTPGELHDLLRFLAHRIAGDGEAQALADQVQRWIATHLGADYSWPGNVREVEQCVRNVMIRGEYRPPRTAPGKPQDGLVQGFLAGSFPWDALFRIYCTLVYARTGSYQEAARRLGIDRRTVKEKVDVKLLERLRDQEVVR